MMNRKTWILMIMTALALACMLAGCTEEPDVQGTSSVEETSSSAGNVDTSSVLSEPVSTEDESSEPSDDSSASGESTEDVSSEPEDSSAESSDEEIPTPEIGSGTEEDPYLMIPDAETLTLATIKIDAGSSVFYGIQRVGGKDLVIYDPNVYVVYDGQRYDAVEGALTMRFDAALASDFILVEIGNGGSEGASFLMQFADPKGAQGNPEIVDLSAESYSVSLEENDSDGFYYRCTAEKDGTIRFSMTASADSVLTVTNNRTFAQRTTESDGQADENGWNYVEIDVQAGDELVIIVGSIPNRRGKYPATDITWKAEYIA